VNGDTDLHDLQLLPNGNYMVGAQVYESGVDLSAYGGPPDATVMEIEIEEVDPQGNLVWSWDSADHIGLDETGRWWPHVISSPRVTGAYDVVHWNSVDVTNNALILSFRQLDAVYKIDRTSGDVLWKLGGTHTPQSLDVIGDPLGRYPLGGQHDARVIPGQALTIHDNFTDLRHRPRVVRYGIDAEAGTATLQATVSDPAVRHSGCCGSAREFGNGSWLTSWGNNKRIGAYTAGGRPIFTLAADASSYRAVPVPASTSTGDLRDSMDARFGG
jgi:hypothetical protein